MLTGLLAMMAASLNAQTQEITITLNPGWNWISYPNATAMEIGAAMGDFVPMEGDMLKSQTNMTSYHNGSWSGGLTQFTPGWGYMYYSTRTAPVLFVFSGPSTPAGALAVTTNEPVGITTTAATCGGSVVSNDGTAILMKGICWATHPLPTTYDAYSENGNTSGAFTEELTELTPNTVYYVRAYAVSVKGVNYGVELSFTTESDGVGDHEYVDLGLPSGLLWATCNIGASTPEDYGDYFAWGETQPKDYYDMSTYQHSMGSNNTLTKYCTDANYGYNGFTDDLTTLLPEDDAATANWGNDWRMPTQTEWQELLDYTTVTWTTHNGVEGRLFTATNGSGNTLFMPAAGYRYAGYFYDDSFGDYWLSSLNTNNPICAWVFGFHPTNYYLQGNSGRSAGFSVRPVRSASQGTPFVINVTANPVEGGEVFGGGTYQAETECTLTATSNEGYTFINWRENGTVVSTDATYTFTVSANRNLVAFFAQNGDDHAYVDLGLPSGLLWATYNVGAEFPEEYGDYFAWGETQPKDSYHWNNYQYYYSNNPYSYLLIKYCTDASLGYNGFIDNLTTLLPEDDAAMVNWGSDWRMPTQSEWQELLDNTIVTWTTQNGVKGQLFTANNGNSLFLPAAGYHDRNSLNLAGSRGYYWSSSLCTDYPNDAWDFAFFSDYYGLGQTNRDYGRSVRAVRSSIQSNVPTGAVNGKFTINENGDQIYFSQGNLQYQASTNTWKFAENQYDYIGSANSNISSTYAGWIDMFGWGTSGYNHGANCYQPWSTSIDYSDYYAYGDYQYNLYDQTGQADWGYNPISNGGNQTNQWRKLTQSEWNYVFNTRSTASGIRYAKANVNNVNGVILLPDDWSSSTYSLSNTNSSGASFSSNTLTASEWSTLEQAGSVFLPAAGYRNGTSVYGVGSYGEYWSASWSGFDSACYVGFFDLLLSIYFDYRCYGRSVRLVRVVE